MTRRVKVVQATTKIDETIVHSNLNLKVQRTQKSTVKKSNLRAMQQELKNIDCTVSNAIAKDSKQVAKTFSNARAMQLSLIRNDSRLSKYEKSKVIDLLLRSAVSRSKIKKEDENLYAVLRAISEFSYDAHKTVDANKATTVNIVKAFTAKQVLNACDVYLHYSAVQLTSQKINDIQHERELQAIEKCENDVTRLQQRLNSLSISIETFESIENKSDAQKEQLTDLKDQLIKAESNLVIKQSIYDYVRLQSNRANIK